MSDKASWNLAPGEEIGPGLWARTALGGGQSCEAYLAWDERLHCVVICKLLRPDRAQDSGALRDLQREAAIVGGLAHPAIVRGFGVVLEGKRPHAVFEHCPGLTLRQRMRRLGPVSADRVVALAIKLCGALHYLAGAGVVHLDVKPSNVITGATPRLIDFSVSRRAESARRITRPIGTTNYMAPEQCLPGEYGAIGNAADIWGLGVTLYEAITGRLPFPKGSGSPGDQLATRYPQLFGEPAPISRPVPSVLADTVRACLARDPATRPTASQVTSALHSLRVDVPAAASPSVAVPASRPEIGVASPDRAPAT